MKIEEVVLLGFYDDILRSNSSSVAQAFKPSAAA